VLVQAAEAKLWLCNLHFLVDVFSLIVKLTVVLNVDVIDSCPGWEPILSKLTVAANESLNTMAVTFHHADIVTELDALLELFSSTNFVTMMFTLNELITAHGKVAATKFLVNLIKRIPSGSLILVCTTQA
jgi:hypothetical protein